jgi:hypothetical protein
MVLSLNDLMDRYFRFVIASKPDSWDQDLMANRRRYEALCRRDPKKAIEAIKEWHARVSAGQRTHACDVSARRPAGTKGGCSCHMSASTMLA